MESQGWEVKCQTILLIDNKSLPVLCSHNKNKNKKKGSYLWWCFSIILKLLFRLLYYFLSLFPSVIAWQAKLLDCVIYQSSQHLSFHVISTQEYWNSSKINIPLSPSLRPTHQLLCLHKETLGIPQLDGEQTRGSSQWNAGSLLAVYKWNGK